MDSTVSINIHGSNVVSHTFRRAAVRFGVVPKSPAHFHVSVGRHCRYLFLNFSYIFVCLKMDSCIPSAMAIKE